MAFRDKFRNKEEWIASTNGCMQMNTSSDEACKFFDAALTQLCGWYHDQSLDGLEGTLRRMVEADPEFILAQAFNLQVQLSGGMSSPRLDKSLAAQLDELNRLVETKGKSVSEQELLHVQVVNHWAKSELKESTYVLERLATLYPEDVLALKMNQDTNFFLGTALPMRNSLASSLAKMSEKNPLKGYVHGMFAFALEESNMYPSAQVQAQKALSLIPRDTWAIHNYAHCLEMQAKTDEGLKWMQDKKCDWQPCEMLACHQYWHTALFHINNNNFDEAVDLLDNEVLARAHENCTSLDAHDAASMIYRMELVDLFGKTKDEKKRSAGGNRWSGIYEVCKPHTRDHLIGFNDAHYMMSFLGMDDMTAARELIESIDDVPSMRVGQSVVKPLLEAMYSFKLGEYSKCADLMESIRHDIIYIGGSHAQRDVFEQLLLVSALKSDKSHHNKLAQRMLLERETLHGRRTTQTELLAQA